MHISWKSRKGHTLRGNEVDHWGLNFWTLVSSNSQNSQNFTGRRRPKAFSSLINFTKICLRNEKSQNGPPSNRSIGILAGKNELV